MCTKDEPMDGQCEWDSNYGVWKTKSSGDAKGFANELLLGALDTRGIHILT